VRCAITGRPVARRASHVYYKPPLIFNRLAFAFLDAHNLIPEDVPDNIPVLRQWRQYHADYADLAIADRMANLRRKKERVDFELLYG